MATQIQVAGVAIIKVNTAAAFALEELGRTRNGADVTFEGYFLNVPGDDNGGDDGPPIDIQFFGETARIRIELTKYDSAVVAKVSPREYGGTAGAAPATVGNLQFQDSKSYRLLVHSTNDPLNFPRVIFRAPVEINKGTKFSTLIIEGEAHKDATGVLYNAVTTNP